MHALNMTKNYGTLTIFTYTTVVISYAYNYFVKGMIPDLIESLGACIIFCSLSIVLLNQDKQQK